MTTAAADLVDEGERAGRIGAPRSRQARRRRVALLQQLVLLGALAAVAFVIVRNTIVNRSAEHTSELPSLMRISYAVFCLKKKTLSHYTHCRQHLSKPHTLFTI